MKNNKIKTEYENTIKQLREEMLNNPKWAKDWNISIGNYFSKNRYSLFNQLNISKFMVSKKHKEPYFASFKQIAEAGYKLKKGSKGYPVYFYKPYSFEKEMEVIDRETGEEKTEIVERTIPLLKKYVVFNIEDIEGIEMPKDEELKITSQEILEKIQQEVTLSYGNPAWIVGEKHIKMPKVNNFANQDVFMAALFHEFSHYTHWKIGLLDDKKVQVRYAFNEVVAETSATVLCNIFKVDYPLERHAGYLASWGKELNDRDFEKALKEAGKVVENIVEFLNNQVA
jgi:antirestriction protein ArdC